jgi:hypothetical protein
MSDTKIVMKFIIEAKQDEFIVWLENFVAGYYDQHFGAGANCNSRFVRIFEKFKNEDKDVAIIELIGTGPGGIGLKYRNRTQEEMEEDKWEWRILAERPAKLIIQQQSLLYDALSRKVIRYEVSYEGYILAECEVSIVSSNKIQFLYASKGYPSGLPIELSELLYLEVWFPRFEEELYKDLSQKWGAPTINTSSLWITNYARWVNIIPPQQLPPLTSVVPKQILKENNEILLNVFFLAHEIHDGRAIEVYNLLKSNKLVNVWWEAENVKAGQNISREIEKAISKAAICVICFSSSALNTSGRFHSTLKSIHNKRSEIPDDRIFILPLLLEECDLPFELKQLKPIYWPHDRSVSELNMVIETLVSELGC